MKILQILPCLILAATMVTYAAPLDIKRNDLPKQLRLDLLETALRHKLKTHSLSKGAFCYVYVNEGLGRGIEERLKEFRTIVRSGDVGPTPPKERWYWLDIGKVTEHRAFITVQDAHSGLRLVELRKHGVQWVFVRETTFYLT